MSYKNHEQQKLDFLHVMKSVKDARETSETHPRITRSDMETIKGVHVSFLNENSFFDPEMGPNVLDEPMIRSESSNGVVTSRKSIKEYSNAYSG